MFSIEQYISRTGMSRRTLFSKIKVGEVPSTKINGKRMILVNESFTDSGTMQIECSKTKKQVIASKKREWNLLISEARKLNKSSKIEMLNRILAEVLTFEGHGYKIVGFNKRSIQRKLSTGKLTRQARDDKNQYRNRILIKESNVQKLLMVAAHVYFRNARANISLVCDKVIHFARIHEEFYELAAIPKPTMIKAITKEFISLGYPEKHEYLNHFNIWKKQRIRVTGAFTDNCKFMDWIIGDDHKMDVDKVLVWNKLRNRFEKETVHGWFWIEGKTGKVLSYILKPGDLNTEDLIISLMTALKIYGQPAKGVLIDNGLGRSFRFRDFLSKADVPLKFAKPYEPTDKSPVERMFKMFKDEFDCMFRNYVGSNHPEEGRHTSSKLSAERCNITFSEYGKHFDEYINGFYETRTRNLVISNKHIAVSIRDLFNSYWRKYEMQSISSRTLRYAYQRELNKKYCNMLTFIRNRVRQVYLPIEALSPIFNNRRYKVYYDPVDFSEIDLYADDDIIDKNTGEFIEKGKYVTTLHNQNKMPSPENLAKTIKLNKQAEKNIKALGKVLVDISLTERDKEQLIHSTVNETGAVVNNRKIAEKNVIQSIREALPVDKIRNITNSAAQIIEVDAEESTHETVLVPANLTEEDWRELE